jgi:hypothetical protein
MAQTMSLHMNCFVCWLLSRALLAAAVAAAEVIHQYFSVISSNINQAAIKHYSVLCKLESSYFLIAERV